MLDMTQRQWVESIFRQQGRITRNHCLRNYVSRLGAIICDMKKDGWEFDTRYVTVKTPFGEGKDYEYVALIIPEEVRT